MYKKNITKNNYGFTNKYKLSHDEKIDKVYKNYQYEDLVKFLSEFIFHKDVNILNNINSLLLRWPEAKYMPRGAGL